eukprot:8237054-Prorocentrum_lima.AAC.1
MSRRHGRRPQTQTSRFFFRKRYHVEPARRRVRFRHNSLAAPEVPAALESAPLEVARQTIG